MIELEPLAQQPGDCWAGLRAAYDRLPEGASIAARYGTGAPRLRSAQVRDLLRLAGFEPGRATREGAGWTMTASKRPRAVRPFTCSVIVPCRNEVENVGPLVERLPALGTHTELIFVDGASNDGTPEEIERLIAVHPERDITLLYQRGGGGKAAAVFQGFDAAHGDILLILDADMTVAPEDLPRFALALAEGVTDFANGTRFTYPMEAGAMPALNTAGNRVFGVFLSWLLGSPITDSLCGTKALFRRDWPRIKALRPLFGGHDPWGDFDLLLGAAYAGLRLHDVPVPYHARTAGESKMQPLRHGWVLGMTCLAGIRRLKLERRERRLAEGG